MRATNLECEVLGIKLPHPFLLASGPPTASVASIRHAFAIGWAGAVMKTIIPNPESIRDASPRFAAVRNAEGQIVAFENFELLSRQPLSYWLNGIAALKREFPDRALIPSLMAPITKADWTELVKKMQDAPIDAVELNFSCPHGMPERGLGMAIGTDADLSARITGWVKEAAEVPILVKLSPNVTDIAAIALAVKKAGADGLAGINTVQCLAGVDLETLSPLPSVGGLSTFGGLSGPAVKPIGLRCTVQCKTATGLPFLGMGGIATGLDGLEYLAAGADAVQVCTAVMLEGYGILPAMLREVSAYLQRKAFPNLQPLFGAILPKITSHEQVAAKSKKTADIDEAACLNCGKCAMVCKESGYGAIGAKGGTLTVEEGKCDGCGLCGVVCTAGAIDMR